MNSGDSEDFYANPDFNLHPVWYCRINHGLDADCVWVPAIGAIEVNEAVCRAGVPSISLHIEDTQLQCIGHYDANKDTVRGISIFMVGEWRGFTYVDAPRTPAVLVADVPIFGVANRRFLQRGEKDNYTEKLDFGNTRIP